MSEKILIQKAARKIVSCAKSIANMDITALNRLERVARADAEQYGQDYEGIKRLLPEQPSNSIYTPADARSEFDKINNLLHDSLQTAGTQLSPESNIIPLLSLQNSPLGQFITASELLPLQQGASWSFVGQDILNVASKRMAAQNCQDILTLTVDAVKDEGFTKSNKHVKNGKTDYLSCIDDDGKGIIVIAEPGDNGTALSLDLTGFSGGSCHKKMQNLVERLKDKGIVFGNVERKCHGTQEEDLRMPTPIAKPLKEPKLNSQKIHGDEIRRRQRTQQKSTIRPVKR